MAHEAHPPVLRPEDLETPEFLARLRALDPEAFRTLVATLKDRLYNLAVRLLRNPDDAEEVLQEAFLTIFDKIGTFEGKSRLSTWIYSIVSNAALSRLRKKSSSEVTFEEDGSLTKDRALFRNDHVVFHAGEPDQVLEDKELQEKINRAVDSLPEGYRELFIMKEIQKLPVKDIAAVIGINVGAVKTRLHRARLLLRARLSDYWQGADTE